MNRHNDTYCSLTPRMAVQLAAPHTWPAAVIPALVALACSFCANDSVDGFMVCILLAICILMQSSVNTFNDYYDYVKGTDAVDDNVEETDATLVYNNVNPKHALYLAAAFLVVAFLLGIYVILNAGVIPLIIALIGAFFVVMYSAGHTPISYLPIGEFVSGTVMGGLIPLACYYVLTLDFDLRMLIWAIPTIVGVALIMFTNNLCDINKDADAKRRTMPLLLGYSKARKLYRFLQYSIVGSIVIVIALWFNKGLVVLPFMLLAAYPMMKALNSNPLIAESRIPAMAQVCTINVVLGSFYAAAMFAHASFAIM